MTSMVLTLTVYHRSTNDTTQTNAFYNRLLRFPRRVLSWLERTSQLTTQLVRVLEEELEISGLVEIFIDISSLLVVVERRRCSKVS